MGKRGVTVLLTVLLAVCLLGMEKIKSREAGTEPEQEENINVGAETAESTAEDEPRLVALTFDDGPHAVFTKKLLDGLKERDVKATFFLIGKSIEGKEDVVKQMAEDGHLVGSHTYNHVQLTKLPVKKACEEITMTNDAIYNVTGKIPEYIRPPFGSWDKELECAVNMTAVLWNVDPRDWQVQDTDTVVKHVLNHVENGSIILLHDVYGTSVEAAFQIVDALKEQGYTFVTVDELILD
ncbi:polysaccharide deacetylase family protein [Qiania dongpingensis]|nr:polysaccharide deacetylase family protein [Qiania dongpingensis]